MVDADWPNAAETRDAEEHLETEDAGTGGPFQDDPSRDEALNLVENQGSAEQQIY